MGKCFSLDSAGIERFPRRCLSSLAAVVNVDVMRNIPGHRNADTVGFDSNNERVCGPTCTVDIRPLMLHLGIGHDIERVFFCIIKANK